jgi:hypothetical protein
MSNRSRRIDRLRNRKGSGTSPTKKKPPLTEPDELLGSSVLTNGGLKGKWIRALGDWLVAYLIHLLAILTGALLLVRFGLNAH